MPNKFPPGFPTNKYWGMTKDQKNKVRAEFGMPLLGAVKPGRQPSEDRLKTVVDKFPRTTDGAVAFIRAWQKSKTAEDFIAKHSPAGQEKNFWGASSARAAFLRKRGVQLKVLKKSKGEGGTLYDWDLLKMAAA